MIDLDRLDRWMDDEGLPGKGEPVEQRFISGGSQNEIYEIRRGELHGALRIPPPSAPESRDEGIWREWRIIEALDGTDVPHTPAIAACKDTDVLGRAFYVMGFVDGWSPMGLDVAADGSRPWPAPFDTELEARKGLAYQLVEGIALLGGIDWRAKGLEDLGRPDGFHERQVDRWTAFLERIKGRELPGFDEASAWLRAHEPIDYVPGLMHGDYQFANVMYRDGAPAQLAAIVDWEMGTVGDPKLDLGWVVQSWPDDTMAVEPSASAYVDMYAHAAAGRGARALRRGVRPPGRRHRLLRRPRPLEAGGRARAGLPAGRRRREAPGVRAGRARAHGGRRRARRVDRLRPLRCSDVRAALCLAHGGPEVVAVADVDPPALGLGQVRVRVHAAAVNFPDVLLVAGTYQIDVPPPFVPGSELAGEVVEVAPDVSSLQAGDRVFGSTLVGAFAEEAVVPATAVTRVPDGVDTATAAAFGVAHRTAYHVLRSVAELRSGEELVVLGAGGGVGLAAVQLGVLLGATVTAVASSEDKLAVGSSLRRQPRGRPPVR